MSSENFYKDLQKYLKNTNNAHLALFLCIVFCVGIIYFLIFSRGIYSMKETIEIYRELLSIIPIEFIMEDKEFSKEFSNQIKLLNK